MLLLILLSRLSGGNLKHQRFSRMFHFPFYNFYTPTGVNNVGIQNMFCCSYLASLFCRSPMFWIQKISSFVPERTGKCQWGQHLRSLIGLKLKDSTESYQARNNLVFPGVMGKLGGIHKAVEWLSCIFNRCNHTTISRKCGSNLFTSSS